MVEAAGLRPGDWLEDSALAALTDRDELERTFDRALRFLESRPRSEREVRTRLLQHGIPETRIDAVVERLRKIGLIDDAAFARFWIENRERFSPRGARALKAELRQKGLTAEVVGEEVDDSVDESASAREVALRRAPRLAQLDYQTFRQKLWALLARRGFNYEVIPAAIEEAWSEVGKTSEEPE
ncbi:MAG TPA: regulatory protein RecX [Chloroflexota bacterium]|nr:regulatory protein RecX [Chloroflexota bacterium]